MPREKKEYTIRSNGDSLQCYYWGDYIGSFSIKNLCEMKLEEKRKRTTNENAQKINLTDEEYEPVNKLIDSISTNAKFNTNKQGYLKK